MNTYDHDLDDPRSLFRIAGWMWLIYLVLLLTTDLILSAAPQALGRYYLVNGLVACMFLACAHWSGLQRRLQRLYTPLMLVLIAAAPMVANRFWVGPLPPGPMSNVEGLTLRLLPVLFIGLAITAWHYPEFVVAFYAVATALLEIGLQWMLPSGNSGTMYVVTFVAVVRSVSFLAVGHFISTLIRHLQEQRERLTQANARLVDYANTLEQLTLSRERNRMARELHDTLAHTLSALSVQLETVKAYWHVDSAAAQEMLDQSIRATRSGLQETRRALKALRASPLDDLGLSGALRQIATETAARANLHLELSLPEHLPILPAAVEQCIYRVAQEAIANVAHHAQARTLRLRLRCNHDIVLEVEDDGRGFDPQQVASGNHFGLAGMRERAELVGGTLQIAGQPGQGTTVRLILKDWRQKGSKA
ncbi:sensor histidine kinase [Litorilinea aerophila]|uniref:Oxygen sensor histidine kinase NreB n=1 Tax=Litorilinea aerophila TaxID=1204385 RepID=A0A540VJ91_9CHLR|nr:sensor histidine kinase [Litorilinea aerophila]MCC9075647.1 sensor histidine kinase [Litorilinea aerophila]